MKYEIKTFEKQDDQKLVGFWVTNEQNQRLVIDKFLPIVQGKSDEQYIQDALALCKDEIDEWANSMSLVGRTWNPETNSFEVIEN